MRKCNIMIYYNHMNVLCAAWKYRSKYERVKNVHNNIHICIQKYYIFLSDFFNYIIYENFEDFVIYIYFFFQYEETLKPTYISVDLSEVELAEYDGPSTPPNNSLLLDVSLISLYVFRLFYCYCNV